MGERVLETEILTVYERLLVSKQLRMEDVPQCILCGSTGTVLYTELSDSLFGVHGKFSYRLCNNIKCNLIWQDPKPISEDLGNAYVNYYTHDNSDKQATIGQLLARIPARTLDSIISRVLGIKKQRRKMRYLGLDGRLGGSLLEIGCGHGEKLRRFKDLGWDVLGQEIDPVATNYARKKYGVRVLCGQIYDHELTSESFNAIVMSHVLEHVPDVNRMLNECFRLLISGGTLVIITPNAESLAHTVFKQYWRGLEPPRHLQIFSTKNLSRALSQNRFRDISVRSEAANARSVFEASYRLREGYWDGENQHPPTTIYYKSLFRQYQECLMLKNNPSVGEDLIALAIK